MTRFLTPNVRRWIYGVCIAAVPVLVYFDLLPAEAAPVILPLVLAVFNVKEEPTETPLDQPNE
ncbi:hypothetical protein [Microbacterium oleivorans]|uniref:Uncharacterized protein n=1 Tax=Microbacterium oleivorans TaxID=273677 RepID=A0A4R5YFJ8_9MICO|nr:hypothetical protein [Microbacterium oleivorans]TDL43606.1 hypothetical protein E2R54_10355 [Microbacterium oleivorans]